MYIGKSGNDWEFVDVKLDDIRYMFLEEKDSPSNFYRQNMFMSLNLDDDDIEFLDMEGVKTSKFFPFGIIAGHSKISLQGVKLIIPNKRPDVLSVSGIFERKEISFDAFRERCLAMETYSSNEEKPYIAMNIKAKVYESYLYITQILVIVDPMGLFSFVKED